MKWNDRLKLAFENAADARGITQTEFAKACGVSSASVTTWLNGKTKNIEARCLIPACKFLRVSPFWVMLGDDAEYELSQVQASEEVNSLDVIRLIASYSQTSDEGRAMMLAAAEDTRKSFPRL